MTFNQFIRWYENKYPNAPAQEVAMMFLEHVITEYGQEPGLEWLNERNEERH